MTNNNGLNLLHIRAASHQFLGFMRPARNARAAWQDFPALRAPASARPEALQNSRLIFSVGQLPTDALQANAIPAGANGEGPAGARRIVPLKPLLKVMLPVA